MTIQEAVKKSIEHGYSLRGIGPSGFYELLDRYSSDVFLDHLFWQSLGKAMGWDGFEVFTCGCSDVRKMKGQRRIWIGKWHRFIDHLAEGKDAESFFENRLTK
jgi:hypothetical protein